jgi:uncharacterized protein DUF4410
VLRVSGTIRLFEAGRRTERCMAGFGAGGTKLVAAVRFVDADTGEVVLEHLADGRVFIGPLGGNSMGAARGLAKEIAKVARKRDR